MYLNHGNHTVPQNFGLLPFPVLSVCACDKVYNKLPAFFCTCITCSDFHLTTLILIHWIEIDHVQLQMIKIDSLGKVQYTVLIDNCAAAVFLSLHYASGWHFLLGIFAEKMPTFGIL